MDDLNDKVTSGTLTAAEWNQPMSELQNVIENLAQVLSAGDLNQLGKAIAGYAAHGDFYTDSGAANAYVVSADGLKQAPPSYKDGMRVRFVPGNTNTIASTVNVAGLGVKNIKTYQAGALAAGDIVAGDEIELSYDAGVGEFIIVTKLFASIAETTGATEAGKAVTPAGLSAVAPFTSNVTDYQKSNNYFIRDQQNTTAFSCDGNLNLTSQTVGPTGSGADNIWTALNELPITAIAIRVRFNHSIITGTTAGQKFNRVQAIIEGGTYDTAEFTSAYYVEGTGTSVSLNHWTEATIPLGFSPAFEAKYGSLGTGSTFACDMYLIGFYV